MRRDIGTQGRRNGGKVKDRAAVFAGYLELGDVTHESIGVDLDVACAPMNWAIGVAVGAVHAVSRNQAPARISD